MKKKYISFVAGRSGGHIVPAMTLLKKFLKTNPGYSSLFFSTATDVDKTIIKNYNFIDEHKMFELGNVPRKNLFAWGRFSFEVFAVLIKSFFIFFKKRPVRVVSMGGYISVPVCFAAWVLRIPVELWELNAVPGAAVKLLSKIAKKTHVCFDEAKSELPERAVTASAEYPVRYGDYQRVDRETACRALGINPKKKIIFVLGGSQGSQFINCEIKKIAKSLKREDFFIIHQAGVLDALSVKSFYRQHRINVLVFSYEPEINLHFSAADIVISRAGAGAIFEIKFFSKPAILVPLEIGSQSHQLVNARAAAKKTPKFTVIRQNEIKNNSEILFKTCIFCVDQ